MFTFANAAQKTGNGVSDNIGDNIDGGFNSSIDSNSPKIANNFNLIIKYLISNKCCFQKKKQSLTSFLFTFACNSSNNLVDKNGSTDGNQN